MPTYVPSDMLDRTWSRATKDLLEGALNNRIARIDALNALCALDIIEEMTPESTERETAKIRDEIDEITREASGLKLKLHRPSQITARNLDADVTTLLDLMPQKTARITDTSRSHLSEINDHRSVTSMRAAMAFATRTTKEGKALINCANSMRDKDASADLCNSLTQGATSIQDLGECDWTLFARAYIDTGGSEHDITATGYEKWRTKGDEVWAPAGTYSDGSKPHHVEDETRH